MKISSDKLGIPSMRAPLKDINSNVWEMPKEMWEKFEQRTYHFRVMDEIGNQVFYITYDRD